MIFVTCFPLNTGSIPCVGTYPHEKCIVALFPVIQNGSMNMKFNNIPAVIDILEFNMKLIEPHSINT